MHPSRRRKKRPNYGIRTVEVMRGPNGFGFTISGQQPCILSCIVSNSPADQAGLRAGDFLISVNGVNVSKIAHDAVVGLIGTCAGPIKMTIAENYYSDSSDEELDCNRVVNARKPKYMHKPRHRHLYNKSKSSKDEDLNVNPNSLNKRNVDDEEGGPIEYKALVGYLGTIEMPKQLLPNCRLQTVCSCIRKLRQEKRQPTAVLMTVLPTCLTLKNASNHILAIYPTNRVVYIGSSSDKDSRYFGLVTSAVCDNPDNSQPVEISNSCHVFVTDPKISDHAIHQIKAESFNINCTFDGAGNCLEFPRNSLYIVSLVQNMYKLQNGASLDKIDISAAPVANSPQPSASSNSDSGIGFRDDCGNISDRILVVEFPTQRPLLTVQNTSHRPVGITEMEALDLPSTSGCFYALNNVRADIPDKPNNLSKTNNDLQQGYCDKLNNIRAFDISIANNISNNTIKNHLDLEKKADVNESLNNIKKNNEYFNNNLELNKLTCRAMPDPRLSPNNISDDDNNFDSNALKESVKMSKESLKMSKESVNMSKESLKMSKESVQLSKESVKMSKESLHSIEFLDEDFKSSVDSISVHSSKSADCKNAVFKVPFRPKKQLLKTVSSCDNLDKYHENIMNYKLSPKVYGLSKPNYSCEELNNFDSKNSAGVDKNYGYGSLQDLSSWNGQSDGKRKNIAQSEPDVRNPRNGDGSDKKSRWQWYGSRCCGGGISASSSTLQQFFTSRGFSANNATTCFITCTP